MSGPTLVSTSAARSPLTSAINCDANFDAVASPNGTGNNFLFATAAISESDVWAVGIQTNGGGFDQTLAEHWNGTGWTIFPTPNPGSFHNDLNGVAAISATDVWAVGDYEIDNVNGFWSTFAIHWNGTVWSQVSTPSPSNFSLLLDVKAVSSSDVWAVGTYFDFTFQVERTLIERWNGSAWIQAAGVDPTSFDNELFYLSPLSSTDVWAVGEFDTSNTTHPQSLAEHWDGSSWSLVATPNESGDNEIVSVAALEPGHAVGVGYGIHSAGVAASQSETWNLLASGGSTNLPLDGPGTGDNLFEGVTKSGASVWAVGFYRATGTAGRQTMVRAATWDSSSHTLTWAGSIATSANPSAVNSVLFAASAVSSSVAWTTGYANLGGVDQTLTESYCGLRYGLALPALTTAGSTFSMTVTAKTPGGATDTTYRGTVHFTSSDGGAVLPANYSFTSLDQGAHTFGGVVLNIAGNQTITAADTIIPAANGTGSTWVQCVGACPAASGTPGARGVSPSGAGTPGGRAVNPSGAGTPGVRTPLQLAAGTRLAPSGQPVSSAPTVGATRPMLGVPAREQSQPVTATTQSTSRSSDAVGATRDAAPLNAMSAVAAVTTGSSPIDYVYAALLVVVLSVALIWWRRRSNRRLHARSRP